MQVVKQNAYRDRIETVKLDMAETGFRKRMDWMRKWVYGKRE